MINEAGLLEDYPIDKDYIGTHNRPRTVSVRHSHEQAEKDSKALSYESVNGQAAFIDENEQRHTTSGEDCFIGSTTFYGNEGKHKNWNKLWLYHSGKDAHDAGSEYENPRLKEDKSKRFRCEKCEAICSQVSLTNLQAENVIRVIRRGGLNRLSYVGITEIIIVGVIANVVGIEHPAVQDAANIVGVTDVEYVTQEVRDKLF